MSGAVTVALAGNPNCGKTTLFNAITGAHLKCANWPGVTVEKKEGSFVHGGRAYTAIDLPGAYSLGPYTDEERVTRDFIVRGSADVTILVIDAVHLERSLGFAVSVIEGGANAVVALNMIDAARARGIVIDTAELSRLLGVPVVPISARRRVGITELLDAVDAAARGGLSRRGCDIRLQHPDEIARASVRDHGRADAVSDRIDSVLCRPIIGVAFFALVMAAVFLAAFSLGDAAKLPLAQAIERFGVLVGEWLRAHGASDAAVSLVVSGAISGVGAVVSFLPTIAVLFLILSLLEDSGYMARAAYLFDPITRRAGLSGRAVIPLLLGLGCSVPAIMATRVLEHGRGRVRTIVAVPYISCSARLPVYLMLSQMFCGDHAAAVTIGLYVIGVIFAAAAASMSEKADAPPLLIELPDYRLPSLRNALIAVWERVRDFLTKAGGVIFISSVVMWALLNFGKDGAAKTPADSFAALLGGALSPLLRPTGLGIWQASLALFCGVAAKELVVSAIAMAYGVLNPASASGRIALAAQMAADGFGAANAYSLMVFVLLYVPCAAALSAIAAEAGRARALKCAVTQLGAAYAAACVTYQILSRLL